MYARSVFNCPLSIQRADKLVSLLRDCHPKNILDAGCGTGEFLMRTVESTGASGVGVDLDQGLIKEARSAADKKSYAAKITFRTANLKTERFDEEEFDVAVCLGATHAFGHAENALPETVKKLRQIVRPGGHILIGEGYWKQTPDRDYLDLIGEPAGIYRSHAQTIADLRALGFTLMPAGCANLDEWDDFEWGHLRRAEVRALEHPGSRDNIERLKERREWMDGYLNWGRSTMGFGYYLFVNPA